MRNDRMGFRYGVRAILPILLGTIPFGLIYGVSAVAAGMPPAAVQGASLLIFAGSAQFVLTQMVAGGAPWFVMILTLVVVNLRHLLYSASIAPHLQHSSGKWKWGLAYLLVDETYVVSIIRFEKEGSLWYKTWFMLGAGLALWLSWQLSTLTGILVGRQLPTTLPLDFALPLTFIAIVVPTIRDRAIFAAAVVVGITIVLAFNAPLKLGLLIAAITGIVAGLIAEGRR